MQSLTGYIRLGQKATAVAAFLASVVGLLHLVLRALSPHVSRPVHNLISINMVKTDIENDLRYPHFWMYCTDLTPFVHCVTVLREMKERRSDRSFISKENSKLSAQVVDFWTASTPRCRCTGSIVQLSFCTSHRVRAAP